MKKSFLELYHKLKHSVMDMKFFYEKNYARIGVNTDDHLPLNKLLEFPTLTIIIRCALQKGQKLYPQIYLDECLHELV